MKPTKAQIDKAKAAIPAGGEFAFASLVRRDEVRAGTKRGGDAGDIPQAVLDRREQAEAEEVAELAARAARDEALFSGKIEFIGMGRFRVLT